MQGISDQVLNSFEESYRALIREMPLQLVPRTDRRGKHSYTVKIGEKARVEVLLRQQALKPKSDSCGKLLTGENAKSISFVKDDVHSAWVKAKAVMGIAED